MARTRKPAAISPQRPALERWELLGVGGFAFTVFGILALIGEFSRDGVVVAALRDAAALAVGRAAPVMSIVLAVLGASLFFSGVRRRGLIRPSRTRRPGCCSLQRWRLSRRSPPAAPARRWSIAAAGWASAWATVC